MRGLGDRMRARARELGIPDAEVARRAGLTQQRYANYVVDRHEPDLETFARICAALEASADAMLGVALAVAAPPGLSAALAELDAASMTVLLRVAEGLACKSASQAVRARRRPSGQTALRHGPAESGS